MLLNILKLFLKHLASTEAKDTAEWFVAIPGHEGSQRYHGTLGEATKEDSACVFVWKFLHLTMDEVNEESYRRFNIILVIEVTSQRI